MENVLCVACKKDLSSGKRSRCSGCKKAFYCSVDCQRADWLKHKLACKTLTAPSSSPIHLAPQKHAFPAELRHFEYIAATDAPSNLLIMLHGLGDSEQKYVSLAKTMKLPQTCALALRAPLPLPLDLGFSWFPAFNDDGTRTHRLLRWVDSVSVITPTAKEERRLHGLQKTRTLLSSMVDALLKSGWQLEQLFLLGFSAGGQVAVDLAMHYRSSSAPNARFGGVVAVSSSLLEEMLLRHEAKSDALSGVGELRCPLLVTHGSRDTRFPLATARKAFELVKSTARVGSTASSASGLAVAGDSAGLKQRLDAESKAATSSASTADELAQFCVFDKGHEMINSPAEAKEVIAFFSKHLRLRSLALEKQEGVIQVKV